MFISKIKIQNFRNFEKFEVKFTEEQAKNIILVGETQSGKSNLLYALRLILDPTFAFKREELCKEDFFNFDTNTEIHISIDLESPYTHPLAGLLFDCCSKVDANENRATGTLGLVAKYDHDSEIVKSAFYTGKKPDEPNLKSLPSDIKDAFRMGYLDPLRDVEAELSSKQSTPLKWALENHLKSVDSLKLNAYT